MAAGGPHGGQRILLVVAPYYEEIAAELERGARAVLEAAGCAIDRVEVPGAFEIPGAITAAQFAGYDGFVAHEWRPGPGRDALKSLEQCFAILNV